MTTLSDLILAKTKLEALVITLDHIEENWYNKHDLDVLAKRIEVRIGDEQMFEAYKKDRNKQDISWN